MIAESLITGIILGNHEVKKFLKEKEREDKKDERDSLR